VAVCFAIAVVWMLNHTFFSGGVTQDALPGTSSLPPPPREAVVANNDLDGPSVIPEDSPAGALIAKDRDEKLSTAKTTGGGFMDRLEVANAEEIVNKNALDATKQIQQVPGFESTPVADGAREAEAFRAKMAAEQNERLNRNSSGAGSANTYTTSAAVIEDEYIKDILDRHRASLEKY
jgi:hypothetical protein